MRWASRRGRHYLHRRSRRLPLAAGVVVLLITAVAVSARLVGGWPAQPASSEPAGAAGFGAAPGTAPAGEAGPQGTPPASPPAAGAPSAALGRPAPDVVRAAIEFRPLTRYDPDLPGGAYTNTGNTGGHAYVLALAARAGDTSVDGALLAQIRHVLTGGNDLAGNGGYPAQHELQATGMLAITRTVPRTWGQLTASERSRADATMTASLVGNAFTTSDQNPYVLAGSQQYTLDGDDNVDRGWNPNYREGMVGSVLVAAAYFGVERARAILAGYDHAEFVQRLDRLGLSNAHRTFTWAAAHPGSPAPTGDQIEAAVRDWSVRGASLADPMQVYADLTAHTYGATVECGYDGGTGVPAGDAPGGVAAVIDSGCSGLPNIGQRGMLLEFDSIDAGGVRSATDYAYGGFKANLFTRLALVATGVWEPRPQLRPTLDLVYVGGADLWYKLDHGYREYAHGRYGGTLRADSELFGFRFLRSLWTDVFGA